MSSSGYGLVAQVSTRPLALEWFRDPGSHGLRCFGSDLPTVKSNQERSSPADRPTTRTWHSKSSRTVAPQACSEYQAIRLADSSSSSASRPARPGSRLGQRAVLGESHVADDRVPSSGGGFAPGGDQSGESLFAVRASRPLVPSFSLGTRQIVVGLDLSGPLQHLRTKRISAAGVQHFYGTAFWVSGRLCWQADPPTSKCNGYRGCRCSFVGA